jgi:serine/threonine protein kinase
MAQSDIYIGKEIGNYHIEQTIASGSFGTVYLARHVHLRQRTVVIKILHAVHLGSDEEKEQFLQEAQILETLKGLPNILPLLDVGIDGNVPYMIAEYAERGSLRMYMRQHGIPLPVQEALHIIKQVGRGLQNAHNQGIVHRDLKPENILFNAKGEALLADFGLSTMLSTSSVIYTRVEGTPAYMAPEQFQGEVSKESDQYALACIAYELLTGRKLFEAPSFVSMGFLHTTKAPIPPRQLNPQIPASVERALLRALAKERTERYPSISTFLTALNGLDGAATLLQEQRSPTSPETSSSRRLLPPSTIPVIPTPALYPSVSEMTAPHDVYNSSAGGTYPPMSGYPGPAWSPYPVNRKSQAPLIIVLVMVILFVLGGSTLAALAYLGLLSPASPPLSATITITPTSKTVQDTYNMRGVKGNANPDNREVSVRQLTSTKTDTQQVKLTHVHQDAVAATGTVTFFNSSGTALTVSKATTTFQVGSVTIALDNDAVVPAAANNQPGQKSVSAHAVQGGTAGNIAAQAISEASCCGSPSLGAINQKAFTGGTDAVDYNSLKQDDVNAVTNTEQNKLKTNAQNDLKDQMKDDEQLLGDTKCDDAKTTEDVQPDTHQPTDVTTAKVTVSVTCNAQVYNAKAVQTTAQNLLKQKVSQDATLTGYVLAGNIVTQTQPQVQQDGTSTFSVTAKGVWYYQWTDTMRQDLLNQIKGKNKAQAQSHLNGYTGVDNAKIDISDDGSTLPSDVGQIELVVNTVNGL